LGWGLEGFSRRLGVGEREQESATCAPEPGLAALTAEAPKLSFAPAGNSTGVFIKTEANSKIGHLDIDIFSYKQNFS
jgi:hypothetical protein